MPDPNLGTFRTERRRSIRQKLHTPVYATFNGPQTGMVVDLSELLDLHEDGFAVQTSEKLETNRALTICLDLPETKSFVHGSGQVIWSDDGGRSGIRFSGLQQSSRKILKEWLFANLLVATAHHTARSEQLAYRETEEADAEANGAKGASVVEMPARRAVSPMEAVRRELLACGDNFDQILQCIVDRALDFTPAGGAALAYLADERMICRARAGDPAPPLGASVDVHQGLSGECVRSGLLVVCDDTESDPRVDPEVSRALGIGSLMAAPIVRDFRVVGLLEIFSPRAHAFNESDQFVLSQLAEMISDRRSDREGGTNGSLADGEPDSAMAAVALDEQTLEQESDSSSAGEGSFHDVTSTVPDVSDATVRAPVREREAGAREPGLQRTQAVAERWTQSREAIGKTQPRTLQWGLLFVTIAVVAMAVGYLSAPMVDKHWPSSLSTAAAATASRQPAANGAAGETVNDAVKQSPPVLPKPLADLRKLAESGNADAQWQIAVRYHTGEGLPHDDTQAIQWFERAAEQGNVSAQSALGAYYWAGRGTLQDLSKAYFWSVIALANGDENSKVRLEGLASQMTRPQVLEARQEAEAWIHSHRSAPNRARAD